MKILFIDPMGEFELCSLLAAFKDINRTFDFEKVSNEVCPHSHVSFVNTQRMCMQMPLCAVTTPKDDTIINYEKLLEMTESKIKDAELLASVKKVWQILNRGFIDAKKDFEISTGEAINTMCSYACVYKWLQNAGIEYTVCLPKNSQDCNAKYTDSLSRQICQNIFAHHRTGSLLSANPLDAAALCALFNEFDKMPEMDILQTGYGAQSNASDDGKVTRAVVGIQRGDFLFEFATEQIFDFADTI